MLLDDDDDKLNSVQSNYIKELHYFAAFNEQMKLKCVMLAPGDCKL